MVSLIEFLYFSMLCYISSTSMHFQAFVKIVLYYRSVVLLDINAALNSSSNKRNALPANFITC